jgi:glycosyltransferase involved in cell wall biosynthesis
LKGSVFEAHTAVNAYNHYQDLPKIFKFAGFNPLALPRYFQWDNLAKAMFDKLRRSGGIFHLWGHSWEIDQHGDWEKLEAVLAYISGHDDVLYVSNGELPEVQARKLLIAAPYFPPHLGGQEQYAYNLAKRLQKEYGWEVNVATTGRRGLRAKHTTYKGVKVHQLPYWFKFSNTPINPLWPHMLRRLMTATGATALNAHAPVPGLGDMAVLVSGRVPATVTYHMTSMKKNDRRYDWLIGLYESRLLPAVLGKSSAVVATSVVVQDMHMQPFASKSVIITPGTDITFFVPAERLAESTVLFVGSMNISDSHKGLAYLLDAFAEVLKIHPLARLLIAGDGTARKRFEQRVREMGMAERVTFLGACFGDDLKQTYQRATMLVLPSLNENLSMVMLEAMATGLPVIGTNVGGIPTCIDDGKTGYLVPPANSQALADKIKVLLDDGGLAARLGKAARHKAVAEFGWEPKVQATDAMLRRAMGMPPRASP